MRFIERDGEVYVAVPDLVQDLTDWVDQLGRIDAPYWPVNNFIAHLLECDVTSPH